MGRIGDVLGAAGWGCTVYELPPGKSSPYHWHVGEEEWLLVLAGAPTLRTPTGEQASRPWDVALFPRGAAGRPVESAAHFQLIRFRFAERSAAEPPTSFGFRATVPFCARGGGFAVPARECGRRQRLRVGSGLRSWL